jgi:hypothetical protein
MNIIPLVSDATINSLTTHYTITQPGVYGVSLDISTPYRFIITQDPINGASNYRLGEKLSNTDSILWSKGLNIEVIAEAIMLVIEVTSLKTSPLEIRLINIS